MDSKRFNTISFLSDYGTKDESVGVVKSVVRSLSPETKIIDITHGIKVHDVRSGGLALARSAQYLDSGVVLAVVDPGVGGSRIGVAIEVNDGDYVFVGPDNGLLAPAIAMLGEPSRAFELDNPEFHLPSLSPTFAGRDIFGPISAHLCQGVPLETLGSKISVASLQPGLLPVGGREGEVATAEVLWQDHFGNLQLNLSPKDVDDFGDNLRLKFGESMRSVVRVNTFEEIPVSEIGLLVDSYGLLALAVYGRSASEELQLFEGQQVELSALTDGATNSSPVTLRKR